VIAGGGQTLGQTAAVIIGAIIGFAVVKLVGINPQCLMDCIGAIHSHHFDNGFIKKCGRESAGVDLPLRQLAKEISNTGGCRLVVFAINSHSVFPFVPLRGGF